MKEAYRRNKSLIVHQSVPMAESVDVVFMLRVRRQLSRTRASRISIDHSMVTLLKELDQHLSGKP
jgi:hypothetical protein